MAPTVNLTDTGVDDHFHASRRSRLERAAATDEKEDEGDARIRSRSNPRERGLPPCPPGFVRPSPLPALEDAKDAMELIDTTPKRPRITEKDDKTPPPVSRRNMIKAAAVTEEEGEETAGAARGSEPLKKDKDAAGNQNKALKDLALQLEARLRIIEGATSNTIRMKSNHPLIEKLKETGEMYNKAVMNNQGHTMGPPHFHYLLGLMDYLAAEKTEKEKNDEQNEKAETKFVTSLREALARQAETADNMEDWELDALFHSCRIAADFQNHKKKTEATSRISFAIAGSVLVNNTPMLSGEKYHSHPRVVETAQGQDSKSARIDLQFVIMLLLAEHGGSVLAGPAPRGSKARQLLDKDKKRR